MGVQSVKQTEFHTVFKRDEKQTILFWNLFRDQSYKKYIFLDLFYHELGKQIHLRCKIYR